MLFQAGEQVLYRGPHVDDSGLSGPPSICDVRPTTVVEDSARFVALFLAAGTPTLMPRPRQPGSPKPWGPGEWDLVPGTWSRWNTLLLHRPGEWRATWVQWSPSWEFLGWYVNVQEPLWRARWGFDFRDLQLDILVGADGSWQWKDQDDFARSTESGLIRDEVAKEAQAAAAAAVAAIEARDEPFDGSWEKWRPPARWPVPGLPNATELESALRWSAADSLGRY